MASLKTWVWLSLCGGNSCGKTRALLSHFGSAERIYAAEEKEYREIDIISEYDISHLTNKSTDAAERIVEDCMKRDIRIITMQDVAYPDRLKQISMPPPVLYLRGRDIDMDDEAAVAIVGTRNATSYGLRAAEEISLQIAKGGGVVVSGFARGIDAIAHNAALNAGGKTVAVLGCGVDICYPKENQKLFETMQCRGTIISEFPPGTRPNRMNFPRRNRIISGISLGTVVVEAPAKSGALITAGLALEQGRDVFAVMGSIFSESSEGANRLICAGARPVVSGYDILSEYEEAFPHRINMYAAKTVQPEIKKTQEKTSKFEITEEYLSKFDENERKIVSAIGGDILCVDEIAGKCGFAPQKILALLTLLEIGGHVIQEEGSRFRLIP